MITLKCIVARVIIIFKINKTDGFAYNLEDFDFPGRFG